MEKNKNPTPTSVKGKPRSFVSERILKGKTDEEIQQFENSYLRAKRVLKVLNDYAAKEAAAKAKVIDNPESLNAPNWDRLVAWAAGYRHAMHIMQELTRT